MGRHRARGLSRHDLALWHEYTKGVLPLFGQAAPPSPEPPAAPAPEAGSKPLPLPSTQASARPKPHPELKVGEQPGGLDRRRWRELRRADQRSERTLDLHGMRVADAHARLRAFMRDAVLDGVRRVTVVTGKGPAPEGGVLRRELPHWLNAPDIRPLLLGAAHPDPSNTGAVNLLLRKRRGKG